MFILLMETQHGILMQRVGDTKGKVGTLVAWMGTAELTLYSLLLRRKLVMSRLQFWGQGSCRAEEKAFSEGMC